MANQASYNGQQPLGGVYTQSNPMPYRQAVMNPAPVQHSSMPAPPIQRESSLYADPRTVDVNKSDDPALAAPANFAYPPAYGYTSYPSAPPASGSVYGGSPAGGYPDFSYSPAKPYISRQGSAGDPEPMGL
jgi:hypothetical protein